MRMKIVALVVLEILLSAIVHQGSASTCFVSNTSLIRREATLIVPGRSEIACQTICINDATCTAIQITSTGNCVIFGNVITATFGQCPTPFTCMLKTSTGCVPKWRRPIDLGYIRNYCSGAITRAPADDGSVQPCGWYGAGPNRFIYIDALMHDGTSTVFENYNAGKMVWDDGLGSWYMIFTDDPTGFKHYFLAAKCVLPPATPLVGCECEELPMDTPILPGYSNPRSVTKFGAIPICPTTNVQMRCLRVMGPDPSRQSVVMTSAPDRFVFCANKVWMQVINLQNYNAYAVTAASCVT